MATPATTVQITMPADGRVGHRGHGPRLAQAGGRRAWRPTSRSSRSPPTRSTPRCRPPPPGTLMKILGRARRDRAGRRRARRDRGGRGRRRSPRPRREPDAAEASRPRREPPAAEGETVDVTFPEMGDSVAEGTVLEWRKQVGDRWPSTTARRDLHRQGRRRGALAGGGHARRDPGRGRRDRGRGHRARAASRPARREAPRAAPGAGRPPSRRPRPARRRRTPAATGNGARTPRPVAARMASAHGIDLVDHARQRPARARDQGGRARRRARATAPAPRRRAAPRRGADAEPIRGPAATLARFMDESRSIPTATSFRTLPVDVLDARRKELKARGHASSRSPT